MPEDDDASKNRSAALASGARDFMTILLTKPSSRLCYTTFADTKKLKGPWQFSHEPQWTALRCAREMAVWSGLSALALPVLGSGTVRTLQAERVLVARFLPLLSLLLLAWAQASAQTDVPDALKNRPPVAAPTSQIAVAPIEVVRSMSETINDFGGGLLQGLLFSHGLRNAALVAAQDGRVIVTRDFGSTA